MKTACIYHSVDLDGWMSAAIVKHWFKSTYEEGTYSISSFGKIESVEGYFDADKIKTVEPNGLTFIGYNYGQPIPDLSEYDRVIMCDISFPKDEMFKLKDKLIWIDHHISAIKDVYGEHKWLPTDSDIRGIIDTKFAACELTWKYFFPNDPMPEIVRLLGRYDCFGHKGTDEEQKVLEFQYGARQCINNHEEAYEKLMNNIHYNNAPDKENLKDERIEIWNTGIAIYQYLCIEAKQTYKNGFEIKFSKFKTIEFENGGKVTYKTIPHEPFNEEGYKFICINKERFNPINFGIDYHKDGYDGAACFHFDGELYNFSLYNDNGLVDCSIIAKQFGGGGHKGAAGFRLAQDQFISLIK